MKKFLALVLCLMMALSMLMHQRTTTEGIGELQHSFSAMADMQAKVAEAADPAAVATQISAELAEKVHTEVVALVNAIK